MCLCLRTPPPTHTHALPCAPFSRYHSPISDINRIKYWSLECPTHGCEMTGRCQGTRCDCIRLKWKLSSLPPTCRRLTHQKDCRDFNRHVNKFFPVLFWVIWMRTQMKNTTNTQTQQMFYDYFVEEWKNRWHQEHPGSFIISPQEPGRKTSISVLCLLECFDERVVLDKLVLGQVKRLQGGKQSCSLTNPCATDGHMTLCWH